MATTLTSKGQITIPLAVRLKLGVATGDRVEFVELAPGQFALVPAVADVRSLRGIAAALNERGIPAASGRGEWSAVQVSRALARCRVSTPKQKANR